MTTTQERATANVPIEEVNPYTKQNLRLGGNMKFQKLDIQNKDELDFMSDEALEAEETASQNTILALFVTPRSYVDSKAPAPPVLALSAYSHASFVHAFNLLSMEEKREIKILRSYWAGSTENMPQLRESSDFDKVASDLLVNSLAEKVRRYKANVLTSDLLKYKQSLPESIYEGGLDYQTYLEETKGKTKHELGIIKALAEGKKLETITDHAFGVTTPVITKEEALKVLELVKQNPAPKLEYRPSNNTKDAIVNAITSLVQKQSIPNPSESPK